MISQSHCSNHLQDMKAASPVDLFSKDYRFAFANGIKKRVKIVLDLIVSYVKAIFNFFWGNPSVFKETDPMDDQNINDLRAAFNAKNHRAYVLSSVFSQAESARKLIDIEIKFYNCLNLSFFPDDYIEKFKRLSTHRLFEQLRGAIPAHKTLLIFPISLYDHHWTSIQIDLVNQRVYYLDPLGKGLNRMIFKEEGKLRKINYYELIWNYLEGIKNMMNQIYATKTFQVYHPHAEVSSLNPKSSSPSCIRKRNQYDLWNCGAYIFHYGLVASEKFNQETPFSPIKIRQPFYETTLSVLHLKKWMTWQLSSIS